MKRLELSLIAILAMVIIPACTGAEPGRFDPNPDEAAEPRRSTIDVFEDLDTYGDQYLVTVKLDGPTPSSPFLRERAPDGEPVASFTVANGQYTMQLTTIACNVCEAEGDEVTNGTLLDVVNNQCTTSFSVENDQATVTFDDDCSTTITGATSIGGTADQ